MPDSGVAGTLGTKGGGTSTRFHRLTVASVSLAAGLGLGAAVAPGCAIFSDPAGDVAGGAGPDVTSISVSHSATAVTFRVHFAQQPPLGASARDGWVDMLLIGVDVPPRGLKRTPRGWMGLDFFAGLHGTERTAIVVKPPPAPSGKSTVLGRPKVAVGGRTLTFSVSRRKLGDPAWFEFVVAAGRETSGPTTRGGADEAPDRGVFRYQLGS